MNANQWAGMRPPQTRRNRSPPVAALSGISLITENLGHQVGDAGGDVRNGEPLLPWLKRQTIAGQRWRNDGKGVGRIAPKSGRIGQAWDDVQEFEYRAWPAVQQQQRYGI